jgi:hypothetical protein
MTGKDSEKARDLADKGLDKLVDGDAQEGSELIEKAKKLDPNAAQDLAREVEEDRKNAESFKKTGGPE